MATTCDIALDALPDALRKVPAHLAYAPARSFNAAERFGSAVLEYVRAYYEHDDVTKEAHRLPIEAFARLTIDETAKTIFHSTASLDWNLRKALEANPVHLLLEKIRSSAWRWGSQRLNWNETVDAFNGLRAFDLGVDGFTVTLDHTTGANERGYSQHSRTFLDGVFGFLVHYKGEHVMTIGFSIIKGRQILLHQVQLKKATGNRWLFRLPANRIEFVIDRFRAAFPRYTLHLADAGDIANWSLNSYRRGLDMARRKAADYERRLENATEENRSDIEQYRNALHEDAEDIETKIASLENDLPRLVALYRSSGRYAQGKALRLNDITHYRLAA